MEVYADGALVVEDGRIKALGDYSEVRAQHPEIAVRDLRDGFLLPGLIDTHVHFPQLRILGGLGCQLLDWLDRIALPEEARMEDHAYADNTARRFVHALASHGTTTALVFGSHFEYATASLFREAARSGLRIVSGLVMSDRLLRPELHRSPDEAYRESKRLIHEYEGKGRLLYAVTPRFALSTTEGMLDACQTLLNEHPGLRFQTHINENAIEMAEVSALFQWAPDYLAVYERYGLLQPGAVLAHNVHVSDSELTRLAATGAAVSHCPCSNAMLGSGFFPMQRHLDAGVRFALGTDVGGGTGFGILKEALAGLRAPTACARRRAPHTRTLALSRDSRRRRSAATAKRNWRFHRRQVRRFRLSPPSFRQSSRSGNRRSQRFRTRPCRTVHARRLRERRRSANRRRTD